MLSFFPTPCGYGLCLLIYYPAMFVTGGVSAVIYHKLSNQININKIIFVILILVVDFTVLTLTYPTGEYHPLNQWKLAQAAYERYDELIPTDLFESIDSRNFLLTSAIDHKFEIPDHVFELNCCKVDSTGSCQKTIKKIKFYVLNDSLIITKQDSLINLNNQIINIKGQLDTIFFDLRFSVKEFGRFKQEFDDFSSNLGERGTGVTGLTKDQENIRIMIWKQPSKFEYKFTHYFGQFLNRHKADNNSYE